MEGELKVFIRKRKMISYNRKMCLFESSKTSTEKILEYASPSRRQVIGTVSSACLLLLPFPASAGKPEIDDISGQLFTPSNKMISGGGSDAARGVKLRSDNVVQNSKSSFRNIGVIQDVYEARFIGYLSKFLLTFDPSARLWWSDQKIYTRSQKRLRFAEFSESVEIGLADYFVGLYGSYASKQAAKAKAGTAASKKNKKKVSSKKQQSKKSAQGILNLFSLLKARYTSDVEKRQLAILFSLISDPNLQPTSAIKTILGEIDNASITEVGFIDENGQNGVIDNRRRGYSEQEEPKIIVENPPSLGDKYLTAQIAPVMKPTGGILRIRVLDGGEGYDFIPTVKVIQNGVKIPCDAYAVIDRNSSVESIVVLDPGNGYGGRRNNKPPEIRISPPKQKGNTPKLRQKTRTATAVADLEYAISDLMIVNGGNGYIASQPPKISVTPPKEEPDWYYPEDVSIKVKEIRSSSINGYVTVSTDGCPEQDLLETNPAILTNMKDLPLALLPSSIRPTLTNPGDPLQNGIDTVAGKDGFYSIASLPRTASNKKPSNEYRVYDSIFGGIGKRPVIKGAKSLTSSEYLRIGISGGICTVIVRTLFAPLELLKTKLQLGNDIELMQYAMSKNKSSTHKDVSNDDIDDVYDSPNVLEPKKVVVDEAEDYTENTMIFNEANSEAVDSKESNYKKYGKEHSERHDDVESLSSEIGTAEMAKALVELRGPSALFQSSDITFLAAIVFGTLGFGATELFRRSFSLAFLPENSVSKTGQEITLLAAAGLACVVTSAVAAPFELLRVRSMANVENQPLQKVFSSFLEVSRKENGVASTSVDMTLVDLKKDDIQPLFSGFVPILSREFPFAVSKFLAFDLVSSILISFINSQLQLIEPIEQGIGTAGLTISALSGALAGLFAALVSHPADLILTLTSASKDESDEAENDNGDWNTIVQELLNREGGVANLFTGLPARSAFFFLVVGLQFFLYDYTKTTFQVSSDDLTLVLDVFYAVRQGLVNNI